ncbi:MAG TPA: energy-coupling factor transporter ATPase [Firmicutes bacterium]|nr:energy-coupling factor transporter ATPase [Bacillota bacterium]HBX25093.1 energy-coupling factor transporter ATPase [Bacillota bacterium]
MPIDISSLFYTYNIKTPLEHRALNDINLHIEEGDFLGLVGRTGCGKSTLIQHLNALLTPTSGVVKVDEFINSSQKKKTTKKMSPLRKRVGLVFQFSEYQLFEETVLKDVCFGPKNFNRSKEESIYDAKKALEMVGLDSSFYDRSPFELSGGEKRRVAIAGILAIKPKYLVVDEPTSGLDPMGAKDMMDLFEKIHQEGTTIILVTHDMDILLSYCNKVVVMEEGKIVKQCSPNALFEIDCESYSLETPKVLSFASILKNKGMDLDLKNIKDVESLSKQIFSLRSKRNG